jgi:hypothetical protein
MTSICITDPGVLMGLVQYVYLGRRCLLGLVDAISPSSAQNEQTKLHLPASPWRETELIEVPRTSGEAN